MPALRWRRKHDWSRDAWRLFVFLAQVKGGWRLVTLGVFISWDADARLPRRHYILRWLEIPSDHITRWSFMQGHVQRVWIQDDKWDTFVSLVFMCIHLHLPCIGISILSNFLKSTPKWLCLTSASSYLPTELENHWILLMSWSFHYVSQYFQIQFVILQHLEYVEVLYIVCWLFVVDRC